MVFFLLFIGVPCFVGAVFSGMASVRWFLGMLLGTCGYALFTFAFWSSYHYNDSGTGFYTAVGMTGAVLGGVTGLSLFLNQQDTPQDMGALCLLAALCYGGLYAFDYWSALDTSNLPSLERLGAALVRSGPGLFWSELLILRALWLIREGRRTRSLTTAPSRGII